MHSFTKQGEVYSTEQCISLASKSTTKHVPVCNDYGMFFNDCDRANREIKNRIWPHKHGERGRLGERGKFSSFAFGIVLQNTFNAFCDMNSLDSDDYKYYHYVKN